MDRINSADAIAFTLVAIGGLNWGLVGLFRFDLVAKLFGEETALSRIIYSLVGLATLYLVISVLRRHLARETSTASRL